MSWYMEITQNQILVCKNKDLLEYSHRHLFTNCLQLFSHYKAQLSSCNRDVTAHKALSSYYLSGALQNKSPDHCSKLYLPSGNQK